MAAYIVKCILLNSLSSCVLAAGQCTAAVGTAVDMSASVTFVVSFSMGVLVAYFLGYISHADPATVRTNKKMKRDSMR